MKDANECLKKAEECLKEVLEFLPDAKITSGIYPGSTLITIESFGGSIKFIAPMVTFNYFNGKRPIEKISPWHCQIFIDIKKGKDTKRIVDDCVGKSAFIAFKIARERFQKRFTVMSEVNEKILNAERGMS